MVATATPLASLQLDIDRSWTLEVDRPECRMWRNTVPDLLALHWLPEPPDIPAAGMSSLRAIHRGRVEEAGGGLVSFDLTVIRGVPSLRVVQKLPRATGGWLFVGSITIPFREFRFVAEVQSAERSPLGVREACVFAAMLESGAELGRPCYPGAWSSASDEERWDRTFPDHPLSKVRRLLRWLEDSLDLDPAIVPRAYFRVA